MVGTPWKRQPCRKLRENHASFDSLNEQANDTRTENVDPILRSRGAGGHDAQILLDDLLGLIRTREGESKDGTRETPRPKNWGQDWVIYNTMRVVLLSL